MANILKKYLIGERLKFIEYSNDNWGIIFSNKNAFTVYTRIKADLYTDSGEDIVTNVTFTKTETEIMLGKKSRITIYSDDNLLVGPEFFVFIASDGTFIVEN